MDVDTNNFESLSLTPRERVFGFDLRSIALLRIALGLLLMLDAAMRWPDIEALYTDSGYFNRSMVDQYFTLFAGADWKFGTWSLHLLSGEASWQYTLFAAQAVCGALLTVGLLTRVSIVAAWVLVASAQIRGPLVITAGDFILKVMLFWSIFLPLSRYCSIDRMIKKRLQRSPESAAEPTWFVSWATTGYLIQLVVIYFCTGQAKWNEIWFSGDAMFYVLHLDIFCRPGSRQLLEYPLLLKLISWGTLFIEAVLVWFLLCPWRTTMWRVLNMFAYWSFHLGILLSMSIGLFPWICFALWLPLIPTGFWNWILGAQKQSLLTFSLTGARQFAWQTIEGICLVIIGLTIFWNMANIEQLGLVGNRIPSPVRVLARVTAVDQRFQMFGVPPKLSPFFVYEARLKDQAKVDLFRPGHQVSFEMPKSVLLTIPTHNWRQLHRNLTNDFGLPFRAPLLDYQVRRWNATHGDERQVVEAKLHCFLHETGPDYESLSLASSIWKTWKDPSAAPGSLFDDLSDRLQNAPTLPY
jgi:Vitamin K-dependent gamma-carboxylase